MKKILLKIRGWFTRKHWRTYLTSEELFQEVYGKEWREILKHGIQRWREEQEQANLNKK